MRSSNDPRPPRVGDVADASSALGSGLDATLAAWVHDAAVDEASSARARRRWLAQQAQEDATLTGVIVELGEAGRTIVLELDDATVHGRVAGVGADFVVVERRDARTVVVSLSAVSHVRASDGTTVWGDRPSTFDATLAGIVGPMAADRPEVSVATPAGTVNGALQSAGTDVMRIRRDDGSATWIAIGRVRTIVLG